MRVVRVAEIDTAIALASTFDLEAMGAYGVIVHISQDGTANFNITEVTVPTADNVRLLVTSVAGEATNSEFCRFGMPLCGQSLVFNWIGAGTRRGRLTFVDEPIAPWGRVVIYKGVTVIAASGTQIQFTLGEFGSFARMQLLMSSNRPCLANFDALYRDVTIAMPSHLVIAGATGGFALGAVMPGAMMGSLTLVNTDAVNINSINWALVAIFG